MKIVVLGAGVVGVTSAWYLAQAGHDVVVVERQAGAARETSYANGGQISVSHSEPWANPHAPLQALKWFGKDDAPLLFRLRADPALIGWGLRFLLECRPAATRRNIREITALGLYSRQKLGEVRRELGLEYDQLKRGILHFHTDPRHFEASIQAAALMRDLGCDRRIIGRDEIIRIEPALVDFADRIVGGDFTEHDESGDAFKFTTLLAQRCAERGVQFFWGNATTGLLIKGDRVESVELDGGKKVGCDVVVVSLGSYSTPFLNRHGIAIPVYPAKGYSATYRLASGAFAPTVSLTDEDAKIVVSRLGDRLRAAGTAEFGGYDLTDNPFRAGLIHRRVRELFPRLEIMGEPEFWWGLRPLTPSNRPLIGRLRYRNLFLNTGHGTLGWTLSCGSAAALADLVAGRRPEPAFSFLGC